MQPMRTKTKKQEIEFDADTLLARVEGFAADKEPAVERMVTLRPPAIPSKEMRAGRF